MKSEAPLAARMRPRTLDEYMGQEHIVGPGKLLRRAIEAELYFLGRVFGWVFDATVIMNSFASDEFGEVFKARLGLPDSYDIDVEPEWWWVNVPLLTM